MSRYLVFLKKMSAIKISSKVDESSWNNLKELAKESKQSISGVLTEAIAGKTVVVVGVVVLEADLALGLALDQVVAVMLVPSLGIMVCHVKEQLKALASIQTLVQVSLKQATVTAATTTCVA